MTKNVNIPCKNPFKVPDNYFDEVNRRIIAATTGSDQEMKETSLYGRFRPYILVAASVTGFVILSYSVARILTGDKISSPSYESNTITLNEPFINDIDILTLEENAESIDLADELSCIRKSDIIDYLMNENIETDDIYEEL